MTRTRSQKGDGKQPFADPEASGKVAPKPADRLSWVERVKPTHCGHITVLNT
jgi:hypothetical protein